MHRDALANPRSVTSDPYGTGWLVEVRGADLPYELRSLLSGDMARRLVDEAAAALHAYFAPREALPAAADGGEPLEAIGDLLDDATWDRVRARFLLTDAD